MNPQSYMKDGFKNDFNVYNQKEQNHPMNAVVKMEPRDEPIELTSSNRADLFNQSMTAQTLNIPTVIPMSQMQNNRNNEPIYEEDKREKLERPERVERPERGDLTIGQPPLPNIMQSANLVTIGGQSGLNHYSYMPYNPHSPRNIEKPVPTSQPLMPTQMNQMEPQNLKIKQEIPDNSAHNLTTNYAPYSQSNMSSTSSNSLHNSTPSPQINTNSSQINVPSAPSSGYGSQSNSSSISMMNNDPLQSLKDVKVPGFSLPSVVAQSVSNERPSSGSAIEIKKEPEYVTPITSASPVQPVKSPAPKTTSSTPTPTINVSQTPPLRQNSKYRCNFLIRIRFYSIFFSYEFSTNWYVVLGYQPDQSRLKSTSFVAPHLPAGAPFRYPDASPSSFDAIYIRFDASVSSFLSGLSLFVRLPLRTCSPTPRHTTSTSTFHDETGRCCQAYDRD